ncbi:hypothetical protein N665_0759s0014 [Sinapis alba]|nr:hypothetical protein N665_0759s0014 [Sinapis alba]
MHALSAARIFQLTRELGHKSYGETIQWLLQQAEPSILAATGSGTIPASATAVSNHHHHHQGGSLTAGLMIIHDLDSSGGGGSSKGGWEEAPRSNVPSGLWPNVVAGFGAGGVMSEGAGYIIGLMPGLELGLSQEGNVGVLNPHSFKPLFQQESGEKEDSQGSGR